MMKDSILLLFSQPCIGGRCLQVIIQRVAATTTRSVNFTVDTLSAPVTVRPTSQTQKTAVDVGVVIGIVTRAPAESEIFRVAVVNQPCNK